jgi:hypothetical protein
MSDSTGQLNCLYYPFSRLLDAATLKYLLLVFDSITFIDEAGSPEWRRHLLQLMGRRDDPLFSLFDKLADDYDMLTEERAVQILDPKSLKTANSSQLALATLADLSDHKFIEIASRPSRFGLPYRKLGAEGLAPADRPTWQIFSGKIAKPLLTDSQFLAEQNWTSHILIPGDDSRHWTLSYEAGSATTINMYLEAAQELNLTPVTTSELHHELVLRKLKRVFVEDESKIDVIDDAERRRVRAVFGRREIINLLGELFPPTQLDKVSFREIMGFRRETQGLRQRFLQEIDDTLRVIDSDPTTVGYDKEVIRAIQSLEVDFKKLEGELIAVRDKVLPAFGKALMFGTAGGGALSALVSFLGGLSPAGVIAASALTICGSFLTEAIDLWNEKRKILRGQSSSVSYLTKVSQFVRR